MNKRFMIKLQGEVYANELYAAPSIAGKHIFNLQEAIARAAVLFPNGKYEIYNGSESYEN